MAEVPASEIPKAEKNELFCGYALMILEDSGLDATAENINTLIQAAGGSVEPYYVSMFAKLLQGKNIRSLLSFAPALVKENNAGPQAGMPGSSTDMAPANDEKRKEGNLAPEETKEKGPAPEQKKEEPAVAKDKAAGQEVKKQGPPPSEEKEDPKGEETGSSEDQAPAPGQKKEGSAPAEEPKGEEPATAPTPGKKGPAPPQEKQNPKAADTPPPGEKKQGPPPGEPRAEEPAAAKQAPAAEEKEEDLSPDSMVRRMEEGSSEEDGLCFEELLALEKSTGNMATCRFPKAKGGWVSLSRGGSSSDQASM